MNSSQVTTRTTYERHVDFTAEARVIQKAAEAGVVKVVKLAQLVFFSSVGRDAWMLDPENHLAVCLALDGDLYPLPMVESETSLSVEWGTEYRIEGDAFTVVDRKNRRARIILGYPTAEIEHTIREHRAHSAVKHPKTDMARERLKTGRNEPCPCGSGRKYKKCCLLGDETLVRQADAALLAPTLTRAELNDKSSEEGDLAPGRDFTPKPREPDPVRDRLDAIWDAFEALQQPTRAQMDQFLEDLLTLPHEAVEWSDVMHELAERGHPEFAVAFRRIASTVAHTKETRIASFYWAAAEELSQHKLTELLPEVVEGFCKLDRRSYDVDALSFIEGHLLAAGFEDETLQLAEHFLPIVREDANVMGWVVPEHCMLIFDLRVGVALRAHSTQQLPMKARETVERDLKRDLEEELEPEYIPHSATVICDPRPLAEVLTPELLEVRHTEATGDDPAASQEYLRLYGVLIRVAREAWQNEGIAPGRAFRGLAQVLQSIYAEDEDSSGKRKKNKKQKDRDKESSPGALLECLRPAGIDRRVARSCAGLFGTNVPRAHVQLDAYEILRRVAVRHGLISTDEAAATERELRRLRDVLGIQ